MRTQMTETHITTWLVDYLARALHRDPASIGLDATFDELGLDSVLAVTMTDDAGTWLGAPLDPTSPYEHVTIREFSRYMLASKT